MGIGWGMGDGGIWRIPAVVTVVAVVRKRPDGLGPTVLGIVPLLQEPESGVVTTVDEPPRISFFFGAGAREGGGEGARESEKRDGQMWLCEQGWTLNTQESTVTDQIGRA